MPEKVACSFDGDSDGDNPIPAISDQTTPLSHPDTLDEKLLDDCDMMQYEAVDLRRSNLLVSYLTVFSRKDIDGEDRETRHPASGNTFRISLPPAFGFGFSDMFTK